MTVLVTGATGTVGAHLVAELQRIGTPVRAFVRDPERARWVLGEPVELVTGDLDEPASVRRAFAGIDTAFLACGNHPGQVDHELVAIDAAVEAGVRRLVKLSAVGARTGSPSLFWDWHGRIEAYLAGAAVPSTVLRPAFYMSNLLAAADTVRLAGALFVPAGAARIAMIDPRDVAAVAAVTLTTDGHDGCLYTLTGPEAVSYRDVAAQLSAVTGRAVDFVDVPDEAARAAMLEAGTPGWFADQLVTMFGLLREGAASYTTDTVRGVTGRAPGDLGTFLTDHAQAFRPEPAVAVPAVPAEPR